MVRKEGEGRKEDGGSLPPYSVRLSSCQNRCRRPFPKMASKNSGLPCWGTFLHTLLPPSSVILRLPSLPFFPAFVWFPPPPSSASFLTSFICFPSPSFVPSVFPSFLPTYLPKLYLPTRAGNVGKSSLAIRLIADNFLQHHDPTIEGSRKEGREADEGSKEG